LYYLSLDIARTLDSSQVTEDNPAHPGETIAAYLTGLPTTTNPPPDGYPAPTSPLSVVVLCGYFGGINRLGLRLGSASFFDSNSLCSDSTGMSPFTLPPATPSGDQPLQLEWDVCDRFEGFNTCVGVPPLGEQVYLSQTVLLPVR
jgi:hypothetical protein